MEITVDIPDDKMEVIRAKVREGILDDEWEDKVEEHLSNPDVNLLSFIKNRCHVRDRYFSINNKLYSDMTNNDKFIVALYTLIYTNFN